MNTQTSALAENRNLVRVATEVLYVIVNPLESHVLIEQALIAGRTFVIHIQEAEYGDAILKRDEYELGLGNDHPRIVNLKSRRARVEATAVNPHENGRVTRFWTRRPHVQIQTVFAHLSDL